LAVNLTYPLSQRYLLNGNNSIGQQLISYSAFGRLWSGGA